MKKALLIIDKKGATLIEALLAVVVFGMFVTALAGGLMYGLQSTALAGQRQGAARAADECEEAVRGMRDGDYANLTSGTYGLSLVGGRWTLSGVSDDTTGFTRSVTIADGLTGQKTITCNVDWNQNLQRPGNISLVSYLTNWTESLGFVHRGGLLVYGGGSSVDSLNYKRIDTGGSWSSVSSVPDIDTTTTNRATRALQLYAKPSSNEKILITRHYDGTRQYIYAQVWDGAIWGNLVHLTNATSGWASTAYLDVHNFSGSYLANGSFMVVYSDGTTTPKTRIWNGTAWSSGISPPVLSGAPVYLILKMQPDTNNAMLVASDQSNRSTSTYWNGTTWSALVVHAAATVTNTKQLIDFDWSPGTPTKGAIVYPTSTTTRSINVKIFDQPSATWSAVGNTGNVGTGTNRAASYDIVAKPGSGSNTFVACMKTTTPAISCYLVTPAVVVGTSPATATIGTYPNISATETGLQKSFDIAYEPTGTEALIAYSDNTATGKYKLYTSGNPGSFGTAQSIGISSGNPVRTTRIRSNNQDDDMMVLIADNNRNLYTSVWNGTTNLLYNTFGYIFTDHGVNGSVNTDFYYDFAWDGI